MTLKVEHLVKGYAYFAGIVGDKPSEYSKSPNLWKAAFKEIGLDTATYVCFDVRRDELKDLLGDLRLRSNFLGLNVTMPHKTRVLELNLIDDLDEEVRRIGAVNTIVHVGEDHLTGHNTDGAGAVDSLTRVLPGERQPLFESLSNLKVLLLGAGGSAHAVAFAVAKAIGKGGKLFICNRGFHKAKNLSQKVSEIHGNSEALEPVRLIHIENEKELQELDLIINATTVGQSNELQAYSPLWPTGGDDRENNLERNLKMSEKILGFFKKAKLFDLIYSPEETVLLKQGRAAGRRTLNGKGMMIWQAVEAFVKVMRSNETFKEYTQKNPNTWHKKILEAMASAW